MKIFLVFSLFLFVFKVDACSVKFSSYNYINSDVINLGDFAKLSKNCPKKTINNMESFIKNFHGNASAGYLRSIFNNTVITPSRISFLNINKVLSDFIANKKIKVGNVKIIRGRKVITSDKLLGIECDYCNKAGVHQFKILGKNIIWGKATILMEAAVLVSEKNYKAFQEPLDERNFNLKKVWVADPENYYHRKSDLTFYKLTKPLRIGDYLKKSALMAKNIVHQGREVSVTLQGDQIKIVTGGIALGSGHYNDSVLIKNKKTNKKYSATIVGVDKVKVNL